MAAVTVELIKQLRDRTGAGLMDCKGALIACDGDLNAASDYLREKGLIKAAKKADRTGGWSYVPPNFLEGDGDGSYSYNACRTPWRIGTDALLWHNEEAQTYAEMVNACIKEDCGGDPKQIKAGYDQVCSEAQCRVFTANVCRIVLCRAILAAGIHRQRLRRAHGVRHRHGETEEVAPVPVGVPVYIVVNVMSYAIRAGTQNLLGFPGREITRAAAVDQEHRRDAVLHNGGVQQDERAVGVGVTRRLHHAAPDDPVGLAALRVDFRDGRQGAVHAEDDEVAVCDECGVVLVGVRQLVDANNKQQSYIQGSKRDTDVKNRLLDYMGEGKGVMI